MGDFLHRLIEGFLGLLIAETPLKLDDFLHELRDAVDDDIPPQNVEDGVSLTLPNDATVDSGLINDFHKIDNWKYRPSDDLYLKHKVVYDNPIYSDRLTGAVRYPGTTGDNNYRWVYRRSIL